MILTEYDEEFVHKGWFEDGREKGISQMTDLIKWLLEEGRIEDVKQVCSDSEYRDDLMKRYKKE